MSFKAISILLLILLLLTSCQGKETVPISEAKLTEDIEVLALEKLHRIIIGSGKTKIAKLNSNSIKIGETEINVSIKIENKVRQDAKAIVAARFETRISKGNETKTITIGSIGVDETESKAKETAIDEWIGLFGTSLSQMFSESDMTIKVDGLNVFPGLTGIRGKAPKEVTSSQKLFQEKIIKELLPIIKKSSKGLISLNLMLVVNKTGEIDGECRIDNKISQEIIDKLKQIKWGTSETGYIYKQFFLIKK